MAHLINSMAYTNAPPWHGLGNRLTEKQPIEVWAQQAGMDWKIRQSPVYFHSQEKTSVLYPDHQVLFRSDTEQALSVVSSRYQVVQPRESAEKVLLKSLDGFTVTKESSGFIQLKVTAGFGEENPDAGKILGWAKRSDFRLQELRNCN